MHEFVGDRDHAMCNIQNCCIPVAHLMNYQIIFSPLPNYPHVDYTGIWLCVREVSFVQGAVKVCQQHRPVIGPSTKKRKHTILIIENSEIR
jgi:hypothetical protein